MYRKVLIIIGVLSIVFFFVYKILTTAQYKSQLQKDIAYLPAFQFTNLQNIFFTNDSLTKCQSTLLLFFNTTCEHCQYETEQIIKDNASFCNSNVLFISRQSSNDIRLFDSTYQVSRYPFIKLLRDSIDYSYKIFGINSFPSSIVYNNEGKLVKTFKGETKVEAIISALQYYGKFKY